MLLGRATNSLTFTLQIITFMLMIFFMWYTFIILSVLTVPEEPLTQPPGLSSADPADQVTPAEGRQSPSQFNSRNRKTKSRSSSNMQVLCRDTDSSEKMSHLQQEKHMLMEEVKAQKVIRSITAH